MSEMSYCKFQKGIKIMEDCYNVLNNGETLDDLVNVSPKEKQAAKYLIRLCARIADEFEDVQF